MAKQQSKSQSKSPKNEQQRQEEPAPTQSRSAPASSSAQGNAEDDHVYGLASVLYHSLQGVTASRKYTEDARRAGIEELVEFFDECTREGTARAKQAKDLLLSFAEGSEDDADDEDEEDANED